MAAEVLAIHPLPKDIMDILASVLQTILRSGVDAAMASLGGKNLTHYIQIVFDEAGLKPEEQIFFRLGATSAKDSWAVLQKAPTMNPPPLTPDAKLVLRRLLTSGRALGRVLALSKGFWAADPGEALIIERWSPSIECRREFRVFCYKGRVKAISQDIWWEKLRPSEKYSAGFAEAIVELWNNVRSLVPFHSCTMDVLMIQKSEGEKKWTARIIEFNPFGAHLNTGSDLFHWVHDADILYGRKDGTTVRFIEDKEEGSRPDSPNTEEVCEMRFEEQFPEITSSQEAPKEQPIEEVKPDWLALEEKLRAKFGKLGISDEEEILAPNERLKTPLRGRWSSAY